MPLPSPEAFAASAVYSLSTAQTTSRGPAGERLGRSAGSSLEFQDRRAYVPGDDVRHLDWGAYARTDQLMVRVYREEIAPRVDLCVDGSRSMATGKRKSQVCVDLALVLQSAARRAGLTPRLVFVGDSCQVVPGEELERAGLVFEGRRALPETLGAAQGLLRSGSLRIVLSDFLFQAEPSALVRSVAAGAGGVICLQLLGELDAKPKERGALRLTDAESDARLDIVLDAQRVAGYTARLERHARSWYEECRRVSARWTSVVADAEVGTLCRRELLPHGLLVLD